MSGMHWKRKIKANETLYEYHYVLLRLLRSPETQKAVIRMIRSAESDAHGLQIYQNYHRSIISDWICNDLLDERISTIKNFTKDLKRYGQSVPHFPAIIKELIISEK